MYWCNSIWFSIWLHIVNWVELEITFCSVSVNLFVRVFNHLVHYFHSDHTCKASLISVVYSLLVLQCSLLFLLQCSLVILPCYQSSMRYLMCSQLLFSLSIWPAGFSLISRTVYFCPNKLIEIRSLERNKKYSSTVGLGFIALRGRD